MSSGERTLIGVLEKIAASLGAASSGPGSSVLSFGPETFGSSFGATALGSAVGLGSFRPGSGLGSFGTGFGAGSFISRQAYSDAREELAVGYSIGRGKVRPDGRGLSVVYDLFSADGKRIGRKMISGEITARSFEELKAPAGVEVTFGERGPIPNVGETSLVKAAYAFENGSTLTAIGKGVGQYIPLNGGVQVFADAASLSISQGTGDYAGARGIVSVIAVVSTPPGGRIPFGNAGVDVEQMALDVFRFFKGPDVVA